MPSAVVKQKGGSRNIFIYLKGGAYVLTILSSKRCSGRLQAPPSPTAPQRRNERKLRDKDCLIFLRLKMGEYPLEHF